MSVDLKQLAIDRSDTTAQVRPRRHVLSRYVLPAVLLLGFCSLVGWASWEMVFPPQDVTVIPVFSTTAEVQQAGTPLFQAAGWIEPRPTPVRVAALAPGVVEELLVVEDQPVEAGASIAELVKDDAKLTLKRAGADLELRQAELDEAEATLVAAQTRLEQPVHLEAALGESQAALAGIDTELNNLPFALRRAVSDHLALQKDYEAKLAAKGVVAGVTIDIARGKADAAKALVEELRDRSASLEQERTALLQQRDALQTQLKLLADEIKARDEATAQVRAAKARVAQSQVAVAEAELQLSRMTIVAPIDGRIFRLIAEPGARIGSGMTQMHGYDGSTIVTMYRPDRLQVRVDVRFEDIRHVRLSQPVEINNPALAEPLTGQVLFISSEADIQKNTLQVKVAIPDPPSVFKPEMLVDVTFLSPETDEESTAATLAMRLYVPGQLVQDGSDGPWLWLADQSQQIARRQPIQTGDRSGGLVEVTSGLTPASRLIVAGTEQLADGDRIRITGEDPTLGEKQTTP